MKTEKYDPIAGELHELNSLTDQGVYFEVPKIHTAFLSKNKYRKFWLKSPFLGTLDLIAREQIQLRYDEEAINEEWFEEGKRMIEQDAKRCAKIIAICVLRDKRKIQLFAGILANYFFWRMTPDKLFEIVKVIVAESQIANFIGSTRFLHIQKRMTVPKLIEIPSLEPEEEVEVEEEEQDPEE